MKAIDKALFLLENFTLDRALELLEKSKPYSGKGRRTGTPGNYKYEYGVPKGRKSPTKRNVVSDHGHSIMGRTQSGKKVHLSHAGNFKENTKGYTSKDHENAADMHFAHFKEHQSAADDYSFQHLPCRS